MEDQTAVQTEGPTEVPGDTDAPQTLDDALGNGELMGEIEASLDPGGKAAVSPLELDELRGSNDSSETVRDLDLLSDVDVEVSVEFGRTEIPVRQLLKLRRGSLVELARRPEQQVTVLANGKPIALGDIVVVDDQVGVHIVELIDPDTPPEPAAPPVQVQMIAESDVTSTPDGETSASDQA